MKQKNALGYGRGWEEEEFVVTLDLYFKTKPNERDASNSKVQKVSRLLMRTPASIVYRLGNYAAVDPASQQKGAYSGPNRPAFRQQIGHHSGAKPATIPLKSATPSLGAETAGKP